MANLRVEILYKTVCYDGFFRMERYRLRHRLFRGGWSRELTRELFARGHAAAVLPYDPLLDAVVLVEQFRIGALEAPGGPWLLEIVAGIIEPGETPEDVVRREAVEEADCQYPGPGASVRLLCQPGWHVREHCRVLRQSRCYRSRRPARPGSRGRRYPRYRRALCGGDSAAAGRQNHFRRAHHCAAMAATAP